MYRLFHNLIPNELLSPADVSGSTPVIPATGTKELSKDDIFDILNADDDKKDEDAIPLKDKSDKKDDLDVDEDEDEKDDEDTDEDEEGDELSELEEELEEPDDEKLELTTPTSRREILKAYPELFKKFPYLEKAYYREQQYTKLLPTIDDAKKAVDKADIFDKLDADLMNGNIETALKAVKNSSPEGFAKLADAYLDTLAKVDKDAYHHVVGNTIKHVIISMIDESKSSDNDELRTAAIELNKHVFGSTKFTGIQKMSKSDKSPDNESSSKEADLKKREAAFNQQKFDTHKDELTSNVNGKIKSTIESHIDPKESMTAYVRKIASREALEEFQTLLGKDSRFKTIVEKLWDRAAIENFGKASVDKIRSAYISKAQTLLPSVIKKARNEALRGTGKRVVESREIETKKEDEQPQRKSSKKGNESSHRNDSNGKELKPGMTSLEYLMQD